MGIIINNLVADRLWGTFEARNSGFLNLLLTRIVYTDSLFLLFPLLLHHSWEPNQSYNLIPVLREQPSSKRCWMTRRLFANTFRQAAKSPILADMFEQQHFLLYENDFW